MYAKYNNYYDTITAVSSPPTVSIDPFNHLETAGQPLTLICSAIPEGTRGTPVLTWTKENVGLSRLSDVTSAPPLLSFPLCGPVMLGDIPALPDSRSQIPSRTSPPYDITLRFNPLNVTDAGTYECHVTVTPQDTAFILTASYPEYPTHKILVFLVC